MRWLRIVRCLKDCEITVTSPDGDGADLEWKHDTEYAERHFERMPSVVGRPIIEEVRDFLIEINFTPGRFWTHVAMVREIRRARESLKRKAPSMRLLLPLSREDVHRHGTYPRKVARCVIFALILRGGDPVSTAVAQSDSARAPTSPVTARQVSDRTRLENERLRLEVEKLRTENVYADSLASLQLTKLRLENERADEAWVFRLPLMLAVAAALGGLFQYLYELHRQGQRRDEERFEELVRALGGEHAQQRVGAAVLLPTFLQQKYKRFHRQVFHLAAGGLRLAPSTAAASASDGASAAKIILEITTPGRAPGPAIPVPVPVQEVTEPPIVEPAEFKTAEPRPVQRRSQLPEPLVQSLVNVFREAYPVARDALRERRDDGSPDTERFLNASGINLDAAFLANADLEYACLRDASLKATTLTSANLRRAILEGSSMTGADLVLAIMTRTNLQRADLTGAVLERAHLHGAKADDACFREAGMAGLKVGRSGTPKEDPENRSHFRGADFSGADLGGAEFFNVHFGASPTTGRVANPADARNVEKAKFVDSIGLAQDQIDRLRERNAIVELSSQRGEIPSPVQPAALVAGAGDVDAPPDR